MNEKDIIEELDYIIEITENLGEGFTTNNIIEQIELLMKIIRNEGVEK